MSYKSFILLGLKATCLVSDNQNSNLQEQMLTLGSG